MCHFLYGRDGFNGTDFWWAGESFLFFYSFYFSFFFLLFFSFILFFSCVSCSLFSIVFSPSSYELADKSEKKRLICGNLVSLVCNYDDDDVYLIYTHPYVCAYLMLKQI